MPLNIALISFPFSISQKVFNILASINLWPQIILFINAVSQEFTKKPFFQIQMTYFSPKTDKQKPTKTDNIMVVSFSTCSQENHATK